jgi:hypothetical protein
MTEQMLDGERQPSKMDTHPATDSSAQDNEVVQLDTQHMLVYSTAADRAPVDTVETAQTQSMHAAEQVQGDNREKQINSEVCARRRADSLLLVFQLGICLELL